MPQLFDTTEINYDRLPVPYRTKFRLYFENYAPHNAWGSAEIVEHWAAMRRLERKKATT
jgi:hypothetical protein